MDAAGRMEIEIPIEGGHLVGYRADGDRPALMLHGGPALTFTYLDGLIEELDGVVDAISYQQRGLSPSAMGGPYRVADHVGDAVAVLDALGIERAWMIGHSWGGFLAAAIAAAAPVRTLGWIAIDPLGLIGDGGFERFGEWLWRDMAPDERQRLEELDRLESTSDVDLETEPESLRIAWPYYFADPGSAPPFPAVRTNPRAFGETVEDALGSNERGDVVRALNAGGRPGVVVPGSESGLREAAEETARAVGARLVVIEGSGHFPWIEVPGAVRGAVAGFVRG